MTIQFNSLGMIGILNSETGEYEYFDRDLFFGRVGAKDEQGNLSLSVYKEQKRLEKAFEHFDPFGIPKLNRKDLE